MYLSENLIGTDIYTYVGTHRYRSDWTGPDTFYTRCAWAGGTTEFSKTIDQICWSCLFVLCFMPHCSHVLIVYFIPTIEDENELNKFVIAPYPPPIIGPYDYCATPDKEYDLMSDEVRNRILKASPHAQIRRQIRIHKIDERNRRLSSYRMHLRHQTYITI